MNGAAALTGVEDLVMKGFAMPLVKTDVDAPPERKKEKRRADPTLALAIRMDRVLTELPDYGREMILRFLCKKHLPELKT